MAPHLQKHSSACRSITSSKHAHITTIQVQHSRMGFSGLAAACQAVNSEQQLAEQQQQHQQQQQPLQQSWSACCPHWLTSRPQHWGRQQNFSAQLVSALVCMAACVIQLQVLAAPAAAAELLDSNLQAEGNVPSELSAAGEQQGPPLSSLMQGRNGKQITGCTRRCVPTCIRGGEGAPGLGPISMRREIVVFKDGFRSRQYCLSECAQVCKLISDKEQQQGQP